MQPALQTYAEQDIGYSQFCDRYNRVCADPATRDEYVRWTIDQMRIEGERAWIRQEAMTDVAMNMLHANRPTEEIMAFTKLPIAEIESLRKKQYGV